MCGFQSSFYSSELSTHKNNLWVSLDNCGIICCKDGRKDYRPPQLSEDDIISQSGEWYA